MSVDLILADELCVFNVIGLNTQQSVNKIQQIIGSGLNL